MYDYQEKIKSFIELNFEPEYPLLAQLKLTTDQLLCFLWSGFPKECISDYQLIDILSELGYIQQLYVVELYEEKQDDEGKKIIEVRKKLKLGWCFKSKFDLNPEIVKE